MLEEAPENQPWGEEGYVGGNKSKVRGQAGKSGVRGATVFWTPDRLGTVMEDANVGESRRAVRTLRPCQLEAKVAWRFSESEPSLNVTKEADGIAWRFHFVGAALGRVTAKEGVVVDRWDRRQARAGPRGSNVSGDRPSEQKLKRNMKHFVRE